MCCTPRGPSYVYCNWVNLCLSVCTSRRQAWGSVVLILHSLWVQGSLSRITQTFLQYTDPTALVTMVSSCTKKDNGRWPPAPYPITGNSSFNQWTSKQMTHREGERDHQSYFSTTVLLYVKTTRSNGSSPPSKVYLHIRNSHFSIRMEPPNTMPGKAVPEGIWLLPNANISLTCACLLSVSPSPWGANKHTHRNVVGERITYKLP